MNPVIHVLDASKSVVVVSSGHDRLFNYPKNRQLIFLLNLKQGQLQNCIHIFSSLLGHGDRSFCFEWVMVIGPFVLNGLTNCK